MARNWGEPELYKSSGLKSLRCQYATGVRPPGSLTQPIHKCEIVTGSLGFAIYSSNLIYLIWLSGNVLADDFPIDTKDLPPQGASEVNT